MSLCWALVCFVLPEPRNPNVGLAGWLKLSLADLCSPNRPDRVHSLWVTNPYDYIEAS